MLSLTTFGRAREKSPRGNTFRVRGAAIWLSRLLVGNLGQGLGDRRLMQTSNETGDRRHTLGEIASCQEKVDVGKGI